MKIPELPQVLFDEFPSDDSTKICIFTQPQYPIPDCSKYVGNVLFFCNEVTTCFLGSFPKKLPFGIFRLQPEEKEWMRIDEKIIDGLEKPFTIACIRTGSVVDSVMILIRTDEHPNQLILYTGLFKECRAVLLSDIITRYRSKISDAYIDNTMCGSKHDDIGQNFRTCEDIIWVIDKYPDCKIVLQMNILESLDLLVDLASKYNIDVRLSTIQQLFFYRTKYKHLFKFTTKSLSHMKDLTKNYPSKGRPKIYVQNNQWHSFDTYQRLYEEEKIINIRLIASTQRLIPNENHNGLIYITYPSHAGSFTLAELMRTIEPKRVHPIVLDEIGDNSMLKISKEILSTDCVIVSKRKSRRHTEVTLNDITQPKNHSNNSFLDESSEEPESTVGETIEEADNRPSSVEQNIDVNSNEKAISITDSDVIDSNNCIVIDSDDESNCLELTPKITNRKRSLSATQHDIASAKIFKLNEGTNSDISSALRNGQCSSLSNKSDPTYDIDSSGSDCELIFPD